ncbi:MAG: hypothetical protein HYV09_39650 [Deltaproteobacteria bacterium]|nr:hypothetical protein [Deltaproteobacteria bacterium]
MKVDLDTLAPEERRLILVASDATYRTLTERVDWKSIGKLAAFRVISTAAPVLSLLPYVSATVGDALARSGWLAPTWTRALASLSDLRAPSFRVGEIPIPHLPPGEAARRFRFDHGAPEDGAAYVLNPVRADHYVRPASLNERLAQEKLAAFLRLAAALGASEVIVTSGESLDTEGRAAAGAPLPDAAGQIGLHASFRSAREVDRGVVARFDRPTAPAAVPEDLRGWLAVDPILDGLARTRLEARLVELACTLSFADVVDVGAEACLALEGKGIDVGGRYRALRASRWSFVVRFH